LLAHAHECCGAARREIEPAEQFLPARFRRGMKVGGNLVGRLLPPGGDRLFQADRIGAEAPRERLEKGNARPGSELGIAAEDFARQRHAGGLAAAGQQVLAQFDQALGAGRGIAAPVAAAVKQRAPALGYGL
jgi:hypothetical protein